MDHVTSVTSTPRIATHARKRIVALIIGALVLLILVSGALWAYSHRDGAGVAFPGVLYLDVQEWKTPSGEDITGAVAYEPATKMVSYLKGPLLERVGVPRSAISTPFSAGFDELLGTIVGTSTVSLVHASLTRQVITDTLTTKAGGSLLLNPIFSPDGAKIAYTFAAPLEIAGPEPHGIFVASASGSNPMALGVGLPISFSPDSSMLMIAAGNGLQIIPINGAASTTVSGIASLETISQISVSSDGSLLAATTATSTVSIFSIDWHAGTLTPVGTVHTPAGAQAIMSGHDALLTYAEGKLVVYRIQAGVIDAGQTYTLTLPEHAALLGAKLSQ